MFNYIVFVYIVVYTNNYKIIMCVSKIIMLQNVLTFYQFAWISYLDDAI